LAVEPLGLVVEVCVDVGGLYWIARDAPSFVALWTIQTRSTIFPECFFNQKEIKKIDMHPGKRRAYSMVPVRLG